MSRRREAVVVLGGLLLFAGVGMAVAGGAAWLLLAAVGLVLLYRFDR